MDEEKKNVLKFFLIGSGAVIMALSGLCTGFFLINALSLKRDELGITALSLTIGVPTFLFGLLLFFLGGGFKKWKGK